MSETLLLLLLLFLLLLLLLDLIHEYKYMHAKIRKLKVNSAGNLGQFVFNFPRTLVAMVNTTGHCGPCASRGMAHSMKS